MHNMRLGYELGYVKDLTKPCDLRNPQVSPSEPMTDLERFYVRLLGIPDTVKQQQAREVFSVLKKLPFSSVLDIGCAHGHYPVRIAREWPNSQVRGIDINENELGIGRLVKKMFGLNNVIFEKRDIYVRSIQEKYDLVLLLQVIEHLEDDGLALRRIRKMVKDRGHLIITAPNARSEIVSWGKQHIRLRRKDGYNLEDLVNLIMASGFKIKQIKYLSGTIGGLIEKLEKYLRINNILLFSLLYPFLASLTLLDDHFREKSALHTSGIMILAVAD